MHIDLDTIGFGIAIVGQCIAIGWFSATLTNRVKNLESESVIGRRERDAIRVAISKIDVLEIMIENLTEDAQELKELLRNAT